MYLPPPFLARTRALAVDLLWNVQCTAGGKGAGTVPGTENAAARIRAAAVLAIHVTDVYTSDVPLETVPDPRGFHTGLQIRQQCRNPPLWVPVQSECRFSSYPYNLS